MINIREKGILCLKNVLNIESNVISLEKYIYKISSTDENNTSGTYNTILYQIIGDILKKKKLNIILENLKKKKYFWNHDMYNKSIDIIKEKDDFIIDPFDVKEGVFECSKCKSKKIFTYSKQTRSCDEPPTTFSYCIDCKQKWKYNG